jgi:hypothetical protein
MGGGGGGVNRFPDNRISQKKLFGFRRIFYTDLRILLIQWIADLSNILARIVDLTCNLVRILDCDFIVELLANSNLDKTIVGYSDHGFASNLGESADLYTPIHPLPPRIRVDESCNSRSCFTANSHRLSCTFINFQLVQILMRVFATRVVIPCQLSCNFWSRLDRGMKVEKTCRMQTYKTLITLVSDWQHPRNSKIIYVQLLMKQRLFLTN